MISYDLLKLFGFGNISEKDLGYFEVITQEIHSVNVKRVIPDIIIKSKNIINIIEVKIESGLRYYETQKQYIDQIELYKKITSIKINDIFSLSKYVIFSNELKNENKILWSEIYSILSQSNNEVIKNFVLFLEENGMKSSTIKVGAEKSFEGINGIMNLIEKSWVNNKYSLRDEITREYIGFWINKGKNKNIAWIGQLIEMKEYIRLVRQPIICTCFQN